MSNEKEIDIDQMLHTGIVSFSYLKSDGSIREARGTLVSSLCPELKGGGRPTPEHLQLYYDLGKESFKSFKKSNLIAAKLEE